MNIRTLKELILRAFLKDDRVPEYSLEPLFQLTESQRLFVKRLNSPVSDQNRDILDIDQKIF